MRAQLHGEPWGRFEPGGKGEVENRESAEDELTIELAIEHREKACEIRVSVGDDARVVSGCERARHNA